MELALLDRDARFALLPTCCSPHAASSELHAERADATPVCCWRGEPVQAMLLATVPTVNGQHGSAAVACVSVCVDAVASSGGGSSVGASPAVRAVDAGALGAAVTLYHARFVCGDCSWAVDNLVPLGQIGFPESHALESRSLATFALTSAAAPGGQHAGAAGHAADAGAAVSAYHFLLALLRFDGAVDADIAVRFVLHWAGGPASHESHSPGSAASAGSALPLPAPMQERPQAEANMRVRLQGARFALPPPGSPDRRFYLDLWCSPFAVATAAGVPLWSASHWAALRKHVALLAAAGQSVVTATVVHDPWGAQTYTPFQSLVGWLRRRRRPHAAAGVQGPPTAAANAQVAAVVPHAQRAEGTSGQLAAPSAPSEAGVSSPAVQYQSPGLRGLPAPAPLHTSPLLRAAAVAGRASSLQLEGQAARFDSTDHVDADAAAADVWEAGAAGSAPSERARAAQRQQQQVEAAVAEVDAQLRPMSLDPDHDAAAAAAVAGGERTAAGSAMSICATPTEAAAARGPAPAWSANASAVGTISSIHDGSDNAMADDDGYEYEFDFSLFDAWVSLCLSAGINRGINAYAILPWSPSGLGSESEDSRPARYLVWQQVGDDGDDSCGDVSGAAGAGVEPFYCDGVSADAPYGMVGPLPLTPPPLVTARQGTGWRYEPVAVMAHPSQPAYASLWTRFLAAFVSHLRDRGWLGLTCMAVDERPPAEMAVALRLLAHVAPELGVALAGNYHANGLESAVKDWSVHVTAPMPRHVPLCRSALVLPAPAAAAAVATGGSALAVAVAPQRPVTSTLYVCCTPPAPNTFLESPPGEAVFLPLYAAARGYNGLLRWAFDSWPRNPASDARYGAWPAGDTFLAYPDACPSLRLLALQEGICLYEKAAALRTALGALAGGDHAGGTDSAQRAGLAAAALAQLEGALAQADIPPPYEYGPRAGDSEAAGPPTIDAGQAAQCAGLREAVHAGALTPHQAYSRPFEAGPFHPFTPPTSFPAVPDPSAVPPDAPAPTASDAAAAAVEAAAAVWRWQLAVRPPAPRVAHAVAAIRAAVDAATGVLAERL